MLREVGDLEICKCDKDLVKSDEIPYNKEINVYVPTMGINERSRRKTPEFFTFCSDHCVTFQKEHRTRCTWRWTGWHARVLVRAKGDAKACCQGKMLLCSLFRVTDSSYQYRRSEASRAELSL
ncbi:hypothetical protein DPEC_G00112500 [Dallia pectoralis]|uniref:Uncharacterized protein n=1 Tax=Dallia pectoralis TaxID=75939 RepID=A0ACC2GTK3_DALPE|nr:hypothetical protein DPEC_G00112500 [Dallia pectoralis]